MILSGLLRHVLTHIPRNDRLLECFLATSNSWGTACNDGVGELDDSASSLFPSLEYMVY